MGLFKSAEERRIERDIKVRQGMRRIEKAIREQKKFQDEFVRNAQRAKKIGDRATALEVARKIRQRLTAGDLGLALPDSVVQGEIGDA